MIKIIVSCSILTTPNKFFLDYRQAKKAVTVNLQAKIFLVHWQK
jgi:hypothetical protein